MHYTDKAHNKIYLKVFITCLPASSTVCLSITGNGNYVGISTMNISLCESKISTL